jgi:hypothetical protein
MEQRMLENARLLWERHAEDNRQALVRLSNDAIPFWQAIIERK